jgi:hypothetical protein
MSFRRVVVALGASSTTAMATAVDLARALETELLGLVVEDVALLDLAALPFASEVGFPSAVRRALDVEAMERGMRAQARRLRQDLAALLEGEPMKWTFEVVRGRTAAELLAAAADRDLLVVSIPLADAGRAGVRSRAVRAFRGLATPLLLIGESPRSMRGIGVVASTDIDPAEIAEIVGALAPHYGRSILFVALGADPRGWASWQDAVRGKLAARGIGGRFRTVASAEPTVLDRVIVEEDRPFVVTLAPEADSRDRLLEALALPLLVLPERETRPRRD